MDIYVDAVSGDDTTGDGSSSNPYKTIGKGIDVSTDGDTVICKNGTYDNEEGRSLSKNLTIQSESGNWSDVIIKPTSGYVGGYQEAWINIATGYTITLKNVSVYNYISTSQDNTSIIFGNNGGIVTVGCYLDGSNASAGQRVVGLSRRNNGDLRVYKCTFRHFGKYGIWQWDTAPTVYDIEDNIFEDCTDYAINNAATIVTENNNCFYNNGNNLANGSLDSTDLTDDPQFTATDTATLQDSSPCIDAGVTITGYVETYEGSAPDIGCYEAVIVYYTISGQVTLNGVAVSGATVRCFNQTTGEYHGDTTTDSNGNYSFSSLPNNTDYYHIFVEYTASDGTKYNCKSLFDILPVEEG